jgi:hypothetical protein
MRIDRLATLGAALLAAACNVKADLSSSDAAIAAFHDQLDRGQFAQIYAASAPEMKAVTNEVDLTKLLEAVHTKLGRFKSGRTAGWNDTRNTSGHFVNVGYQATYEKGPAMEEFLFRIDGDRAALAGYHVNSNALITG